MTTAAEHVAVVGLTVVLVVAVTVELVWAVVVIVVSAEELLRLLDVPIAEEVEYAEVLVPVEVDTELDVDGTQL